MISRRQFLHLAAGGAAIRSGASRTVSALASESLVEHLLLLSPEQLAKLEEGRKKGLIELAPVSLPPDPNALNNHLGWPVATRAGDTLIVARRRIPGHWKGLERTDDLHSYTMVVRSTDAGKTWNEPFDLRQVMKPGDRYRGGHIPLAHRYKFARDQDSNLGYKIHLNAIGDYIRRGSRPGERPRGFSERRPGQELGPFFAQWPDQHPPSRPRRRNPAEPSSGRKKAGIP